MKLADVTFSQPPRLFYAFRALAREDVCRLHSGFPLRHGCSRLVTGAGILLLLKPDRRHFGEFDLIRRHPEL